MDGNSLMDAYSPRVFEKIDKKKQIQLPPLEFTNCKQAKNENIQLKTKESD